jgi:tetratricopeptide (TPR) repeat protein
MAASAAASGAPFIPASESRILADLPRGSTHTPPPMRALASARLDVALPLAQFYISQARTTGDLRFLGYAEAALGPWRDRTPTDPGVLVLDATILQSRHSFEAALAELDRALAIRPTDAQAWLTRATVLRVLGRYAEATASCAHLAPEADPTITQLCSETLRGLSGHLRSAYTAVQALPQPALSAEARAWRYSELGEMAERLGDDADAEHWFGEGLAISPGDLYLRAAYADLLLRHGRSTDVMRLLSGYESMEPMLLRLAIARKLEAQGQSGTDPALAQSEALLAAAFSVEELRGEAVHRREQARFLLDVANQPKAALDAAQQNWRVQREPDDLLILVRAAQAAHRPDAAAPAWAFIDRNGIEDARIAPYRSSSQ